MLSNLNALLVLAGRVDSECTQGLGRLLLLRQTAVCQKPVWGC